MMIYRKVSFVILFIFVAVLGFWLWDRSKNEPQHVSEIKAKQETTSQPTQTLVTDDDCVKPVDVSLLKRKDGAELCVSVLRKPSNIGTDHSYDPVHVTYSFSLITSSGIKQELAKHEEGYRFSKDQQDYVSLPDRPLATNWKPMGWSLDEHSYYFTRSQGLPIDGPGANAQIDLWSLDIASGILKQVLNVGDIAHFLDSASILDVDVPNQRIIVLKDGLVWVESFSAKVISTLPSTPFSLKEVEGLGDTESYEFNNDGSGVIVKAQREVPYGSGEMVQYGPATFDIATGKYIK